MSGRIRSVAVGATAAEAAAFNARRTRIRFSVGDATNASSVMIIDGNDRTATGALGFPLQNGQTALEFVGVMATHRFSVIRLAAVDCVLGVIEEFDDDGDDVPVVEEP